MNTTYSPMTSMSCKINRRGKKHLLIPLFLQIIILIPQTLLESESRFFLFFTLELKLSVFGLCTLAFVPELVAKMVAYGTTKAAALMIMTKWALQLKPEGFTVVSIAPGLVDTTGTMDELSESHLFLSTVSGMLNWPLFPGGTDGESKKSEANFKKGGHKIRQQTPEESVTMQLQVIDGLKLSDTGAHLPHNGKGFLD